MIAYWTAYFKSNYKIEYFTSLFNSFVNNFEKISDCILEIRKTEIEIKKPNINYSKSMFSIENIDGKNTIRFGLSSLKNVGINSINKIIDERDKNGSFKSLEDFSKRMDSSWMNKKILESLVKSGSMDDFGDRGSLFDSIERILLQINNITKLRNSNQTTMFDLFGEEVETPTTEIEISDSKTEDIQKMHWEKEILGVAFTENPNHKEMIKIKTIDPSLIVSLEQLNSLDQNKSHTFIAEVRSYEKRTSRKGSDFMIVKLELIESIFRLSLFSIVVM